jgi:predicted transcriptional regulator
MSLPCESISRRLLPLLRAYIAKELIEKYGLKQIEIAKKLGTTQAAISQYFHAKRGAENLEQFKDILPTIQLVASEIAREIALGRIDANKIAPKFCEICLYIQKKISK